MENITKANLQTITVEVEDFNFEDLGNFLEVTSYIQLTAEPLLASIQEIQIKNEKIYIHDKFARIICYDIFTIFVDNKYTSAFGEGVLLWLIS